MDISAESSGDLPTVRAARRSLVVLAGLPGAGKSTLLANLDADPQVLVLDSEQVRRQIQDLLPEGTPYRWYRPVVHMTHRARIGWCCVRNRQLVLAHEPSTRATTRAMLVLFGRVAGRRRVMVWLDAAPAEALAGQRERGRFIKASSFRRHVRRALQIRQSLRAGQLPRGWSSMFIFQRADLARGFRIEVHE